MKLVCDVMGADKPLEDLVEGIVRAINKYSDLEVIISGPELRVKEALKNYTFNAHQVSYLDANDVVTNMDQPTRAFRTKPESSMIKGINRAKEDDVDGFVSCGSTGAVLVSSTFLIGRIGEARPCLATPLLNQDGKPMLLLDCGANIQCTPEMLVDFAKMGSAYMSAIGIENPRIGLLSNGAEDKKGTELVVNTNHLLRELDTINFIGNVEGTTFLTGVCDVVVSDGYSGNILLKSVEGAAKTIFRDFAIYAKMNPDKAGVMDALGTIVAKYDFNSVGGATLLGVNKTVVKGHGASSSQTYFAVLEQAYKASNGKLVEKIKNLL